MTTEHTDVTIPAGAILFLREDGTTLATELGGEAIKAAFAALPTPPVGAKTLPMFLALSGNGEAEPVAFACEADIRSLDKESKNISLSKVAMPQYGMKMPLYAAPPAAATAADLTKIREALKNLIQQLDVVHTDKHYRAVWELSHMRNGPYTGPTYEVELGAAREAILDAEVKP